MLKRILNIPISTHGRFRDVSQGHCPQRVIGFLNLTMHLSIGLKYACIWETVRFW